MRNEQKKAEDLRIGDLVRVSHNCSIPEGTVCVVTEIYPERTSGDKKGIVRLSYTDGTDDGPWGVLCSNIEGLPLTPEILEKNGWSNRHDGSSSCDIYSKGKGSFHVRLEQCIYKKQEGFDFAVGDSTYRFGNKIEHVHELQHILWALGLDSNLKI